MQITQQEKAGTMVFTLSGRMDFQARHEFPQAMDNAKLARPNRIVLNFSQVSFIDSGGLGLLLLAHKSLKEDKIRLSIDVTEGYVKKILTLRNIGEKIPISIIEAPSSLSIPTRVVSKSKMPVTPPCVLESPEMEELLLPILDRLERKDFTLPVFPTLPIKCSS